MIYENDHENDAQASRISTRAKFLSTVAAEAAMRIHKGFSCMPLRWFSICCLVLMMWIAAVAHAQQPGVLEGRVMDPSGAVIPGASVLVEPQNSGPSKPCRPMEKGAIASLG